MIEVRDLRVHYGQYLAVDRLSFSVERGSVYGLIGPNGAGKTTTIRAIATLLEPTYGEIIVDGIPVLQQPEEARRKMGYMPDFPPVYDDLKVEEFCDLFAHAYGLIGQRKKEKVEECLELTNLQDKRKEFCKNLSRGMKQRALLAKTLVHDPSVLLLDEPGANLDPKARIDLRNLLRQLARDGRTILVSSHVLSELQDLCDAIGIMREGTMVVSGSMEEVVSQSSPQRVIRMELSTPCPGLEAIVEDMPSVSNLVSLGQSGLEYEINHQGDKADTARVLEQLIKAGASVCGFHLKQSKVEDLFLEVESGNLSANTDAKGERAS
ncbi:MAG: ABC transporter ATP-binding protein [Akkermansiaceae bacterium]